MNNLTHKYLSVSNFRKLLLKWHKLDNSRVMPWKGEKDAYKVWLSEIILQQTRVEQGLAYYEKFIQHFPRIADLARAEEKKVFKLWEGLGYYSRCRNLIATAKLIDSTYQGTFPDTFDTILSLKGVGPYTAAAIASFAFSLPHAVVDGNVLRVLARVFGIDDAIDGTIGKKKISRLADELLDKNDPGSYNQAIMDFGATVCRPAAPLCDECIFQKKCRAYQQNAVQHLPRKEKKIRQRNRFFYFLVVQCGSKIAIRERKEKDIWQHLYEFPMIELPEKSPLEIVIDKARNKGWVDKRTVIFKETSVFRQKLTHQTIMAAFITLKISSESLSFESYEWVDSKSLPAYSFPKIINDYLANHPFDIDA